MEDRYAAQPVEMWFWAGAIASLLFMLLGCLVYGMHVYTDPAALPLDQRVMFEAEPAWVTMMLGVASIVGAVGAVLLLLRRRAAVPLLLISLIGAGVWFVGLMTATTLRDLLSTTEIAVLAVTFALAWTIYWFARHSRQRGWLR
jgi:hypothetical protein